MVFRLTNKILSTIIYASMHIGGIYDKKYDRFWPV
jgi:hypothetical protein